MAVILKVWFANSLYGISASALAVELFKYECQRTLQMWSQHYDVKTTSQRHQDVIIVSCVPWVGQGYVYVWESYRSWFVIKYIMKFEQSFNVIISKEWQHGKYQLFESPTYSASLSHIYINMIQWARSSNSSNEFFIAWWAPSHHWRFICVINVTFMMRHN